MRTCLLYTSQHVAAGEDTFLAGLPAVVHHRALGQRAHLHARLQAELVFGNQTDGQYTFEKPLMIYNPYGTNTLGLNLYFTTDEACEMCIRDRINPVFGNFEEKTARHILTEFMGRDNYLKLRNVYSVTYADGHLFH